MKKPLLASLLSCITMSSCAVDKPIPSQVIMDGHWVMRNVPDKQEHIEPPSFTLSEVNSKLQISGTNGCNSFFGFVEIDGDQLKSIGPMSTTRKLCQEQATKLEREFMSSLEQGLRYRDGRLYTHSGGIIERRPKEK